MNATEIAMVLIFSGPVVIICVKLLRRRAADVFFEGSWLKRDLMLGAVLISAAMGWAFMHKLPKATEHGKHIPPAWVRVTVSVWLGSPGLVVLIKGITRNRGE